MEQLHASVRESRGKGAARQARLAGSLPAVCYGGGGEAISVTVDVDALRKVLAGPHKNNTIFTLAIEGAEAQTVMMKTFQRHPVTRRPLHADFLIIGDTKPVVVSVPIDLLGEPAGVKAGGVLRQVERTVKVRCLAADIPVALSHDVTELEIKQSFLLSEIESPDGVELVYDQDAAFVQVSTPRGVEVVAEEGEEEGEGEGEGEAAEEE